MHHENDQLKFEQCMEPKRLFQSGGANTVTSVVLLDEGGCLTGDGVFFVVLRGFVPRHLPSAITKLIHLRCCDRVWEGRRELPLLANYLIIADVVCLRFGAQLSKARSAVIFGIDAPLRNLRRYVFTDTSEQAAICPEKLMALVAYVTAVSHGGGPADPPDHCRLDEVVAVTSPIPWQFVQIWLSLPQESKEVCDETRHIPIRARAKLESATEFERETLGPIAFGELAYLVPSRFEETA